MSFILLYIIIISLVSVLSCLLSNPLFSGCRWSLVSQCSSSFYERESGLNIKEPSLCVLAWLAGGATPPTLVQICEVCVCVNEWTNWCSQCFVERVRRECSRAFFFVLFFWLYTGPPRHDLQPPLNSHPLPPQCIVVTVAPHAAWIVCMYHNI